MLKKLLTIALPLALPTLLYFTYSYLEWRRALASGTAAPPPWWIDVPWVSLAAAGAALLAVVLVALALLGGHEISGVYEPARLIDGRLVPGTTTAPPVSTD